MLNMGKTNYYIDKMGHRALTSAGILLLISVFLSFSCGLKKPPKPVPKPEKVEDPIKAPKKGGYELAE